MIAKSGPSTATAARGGGWLTLLGLTLFGYALLGRGGAYVGVPPVFIGEVVLLCGVVVFLRFGRWHEMLDLPAVWSLLLLVAWGLARTLPDLPRYGPDALRAAV